MKLCYTQSGHGNSQKPQRSSRQWAGLRSKDSLDITFTALLLVIGVQTSTRAQIIPDSTLPTNSEVTQAGTTYTITNGSVEGPNLFHSFTQFSVPDGTTAFFDHATTINRVITRVTGNGQSTIDGLIQANGTADFFLLNPNGVVFGPDAQLDIGGSFITSSAQQIIFADGQVFSASNPTADPLLTINTPIGLQFGSSPGDIVVQGPGNRLGFDADNFVLDRSERPDGLQVNDGKTLAFVGGGVTLDGGNLTALDGRISLGGVDSDQLVGLSEASAGWQLDYGNVTTFQDIRLSNAASIDVSGTNGGDIHLEGQKIRLTGGSSVLATTLADGVGGQTVINASDRLVLTGFSTEADGTPILPSSVISGLETDATGIGGTIEVQTPILRLVRGGAIASNNLGSGVTRDLTVTAPRRIVVDGGIPELEFSGGLLVDVYGEGDGGALLIDTGLLFVTGGGEVSASTLGGGDSGALTITAETVDVFGGAPVLFSSQIVTSVQPDASGNANNLAIVTDQLFVSGGAIITSDTFGQGNGGDLRISAQTIDLFGASPSGLSSGLFAGTEFVGNGGNLFVDAHTIQVAGGADIQTSTISSGNAGNLRLKAQDISLLSAETNSTVIAAAVDRADDSIGTGNGGSVSIQAVNLQVLGGAQVIVGTLGSGNAGLMQIEVDNIHLTGTNPMGRSGLFASAIVGTGEGGDIVVRGDRLTITDGATISASNFPSDGNIRRAGQGEAGSININVADIQLSNAGKITASTVTGGRGDISIQTGTMFLTNRSQMTTNSQGQEPGGNIVLDADVLVGLGNSDITANAEASRGGRILINADQIYGLVFREQLTPLNDVTATSELGAEFNGVVQINNPDIDIAPGTLPDVVIVPEKQLVVTCEPFIGSLLLEAGRGGLPTSPFQPVYGQAIWQDWRVLNLENNLSDGQTVESIRPASGHSNSSAIAPIQEAERFSQTQSGNVILARQSRARRGFTVVPTAKCDRVLP